VTGRALQSSLPLVLACLWSPPAWAQRAAVPDDFLGLTHCEAGRAVTRFRADVRDSLLREQLEAHEAVHRRQSERFASCETFMATLRTARSIIAVELPAYCAQWRVAISQGADSAATRRDFAWRIAAQSGAMENRLDIVRRLEHECPPTPRGRANRERRRCGTEPERRPVSSRDDSPQLSGGWLLLFGGCTGVVPAGGGGLVVGLVGGGFGAVLVGGA